MKISFLIPGNEEDVSGGHLYNRAIAKEINAGEHRCELIYAADKESFLEHLKRPHEILLIDAWGLLDIDPDVLQQPFHLLAHHPLALDNTVEGDSEKEIVFWNKAQSVIVTGDEALHHVKKYTNAAVHLVVPGIDFKVNGRDYPQHPKFIVGLGSFIERKGDLLLLDMLQLLPKEVVVHRYGPTFDQTFLQKIKHEILLHDLHERFIIHGEITQKEKEAVFSKCDLMLFPSQYESFGMAIQEALCYKIPSLVSDLPHLKQRFGNAGVVYMANDAQVWAKKVKKLLDKSQDYAYLCSAFTNYSASWPAWGTQAQKIIRVFID